jgi:hypothetical protein
MQLSTSLSTAAPTCPCGAAAEMLQSENSEALLDESGAGLEAD